MSHETFSNKILGSKYKKILQWKDHFETWISMTNQGKTLKNIKYLD